MVIQESETAKKLFCNDEMMIAGQNCRTFNGAWFEHFGTGDYILYTEIEDNSFEVFVESLCTLDSVKGKRMACYFNCFCLRFN